MNSRSRKIYTILIVLFFLGPRSGAQEGESNSREARFHDIYLKHNESPTSEEAWQKALTEGAAQTYTVQEGDTLWGISETFFGDPQFYPKIWALNGQSILNPHEINPDQSIRFVEGTLGEPPSMDMGEAVSPEILAIDEATNIPEKEIPASTSNTRPFRKLPGSLPYWEMDPSALTQYVFKIDAPIPKPYISEVFLGAYLDEADLASLGFVSENEGGHQASGDEQFVFVKMKEAPTQARYLIVKKDSTIKDSVSGNKANQILVQAEIEMQNSVNADKGLYRAKVVKLVTQIDVGSQLIASEMPTVNLKEDSAPVAANSKVIGGAFSSERLIFGNDEIVFLNEGSEKGLVAGQILPVYRDQRLREAASEAISNHRIIGKIKVIRVTPNFSTAVVTSVTEEIHVGDKTYSE